MVCWRFRSTRLSVADRSVESHDGFPGTGSPILECPTLPQERLPIMATERLVTLRQHRCGVARIRKWDRLPSLFPKNHRRPLRDQPRQFQRIPVRHPHTPMRLHLPDPPRLWRPMYSVMRLIDVDPHIAHRIIRPRRNLHFRLFRIAIPKKLRIVMKRRIARYRSYPPCSQRQEIVCAAGCHRRPKNNSSSRAIYRQTRRPLRYHHSQPSMQ